MDRKEKLKEFLAQDPGDAFLRHALALEHIKLGEEQQAKELFEAILGSDPGYIGTYYHLAKLLERVGDNPGAIKIYEQGMKAAEKAGEMHALGELKGAYEELIF